MVNSPNGFLEKIGIYLNLLFGGSSTDRYATTGISLGKFFGDLLNKDAPKFGGLEKRIGTLDSRPAKPSIDYDNLPPAFFDYGAF